MAPYQAGRPPAPVSAPTAATTVCTQDILSFDLALLGGGFQAVLLQLGDTAACPGLDSSSRSNASMCAASGEPSSGSFSRSNTGGRSSSSSSWDSDGSGSTDSGGSGGSSSAKQITWERLHTLQLGGSVMACGLLCVWASKGQVASAVRFLASQGCKYVENLTWVQLGPNNRPLQVREGVKQGHRLCGSGGWARAGHAGSNAACSSECACIA